MRNFNNKMQYTFPNSDFRAPMYFTNVINGIPIAKKQFNLRRFLQ